MIPNVFCFLGYRPWRWMTNALLILLVWGLAGVTGLPAAAADSTGTPADDAQPAAATVESTRPASAWPHERSDLAPDPNVVFGRLANGFRYAMMTNHEPASRVSMHLCVLTGSLNEKKNQRGAAHFLEHMQFNGSTHFPPGELVKYFQRIGMQFGADANAKTGFSSTVYDILLPDGSEKSIGEGMRVLRDYAAGALLLESEVDKERRVILAEKRSRDSAGYRTFEATLAFELDGARPPRRLPIGTEATIERMDATVLGNYYKTWYRPETMVLVMVGDFSMETARPLAEKIFADLRDRALRPAEVDFGRFRHRGLEVLYHPEAEAGSTSVSIETLKQVAPEPDSSDLQDRRLVLDVAHRIVQDRLDALLRRPGAPFTSARAGSGRYLQRVDYAEIGAHCSPENWKETTASLEQTLRRALAYGFTADELKRVKMDFMSELDDAVKKAPTRKSQTLANEIIGNLTVDRVFRSPAQERNFFNPRLQALTVDQVNAAFRKNWNVDQRLLLVTGNVLLGESRDDGRNKIEQVYRESRKVAVTPPAAKETVVFPYLTSPQKPGVVTRRERIDDLGIEQIDYANGNRLNLKRTDFKVGEVRFKLVFGRGRASQPATLPGLAAVTRDLVNESGLGKLDAEQLQRAFAGKMTHIRFAVEEDRFAFTGASVPGELPLMFQILDAHLRDPGFRKAAFRLCMERYHQRYEAMARTTEGAMKLHGLRFLAGGDNRFGLPPYGQFRRLTLEQVRRWIEPVMKNGRLELSIVGDFDPSEAERLGALYLGGLAPRDAPRAAAADPIRFPRDESLRIPVTTRIPKGLVVVSFPTDDIWNIQRTRRLSVLADVVSDRLRESIREELGAAYSPFAYNRPSRAHDGYGLFQIFVQVAPDEADMVERRVQKIVTDLQKGGIAADELRRALDPTLTSIKDLKRQNRYWLDTVLAGSREHPEQIAWCRSILPDYAAIGVDDLLPLAQKFLRKERSATVVVLPTAQSQDSTKADG